MLFGKSCAIFSQILTDDCLTFLDWFLLHVQSLIEFSEETKKGKREPGTVVISAAELAALRAEAAKKK